LAAIGSANNAGSGNCKPGGSICRDNSECCTGYCLPSQFPKKNGQWFSTCTYTR
jgi:hypothetical protein